MAFKKAERTQLWLRLALFGPPGSGKTMSGLRIARGIADKIDGRMACIDTEARSASKYADRIPFDVDDLSQKTIENYIQSMDYAAQEGYRVLVIDSLSHAWQELLDEVDRIAKASTSKNSWAAWSEGTPKQRKLVNAILNFPGHIIVTMRSKIEWDLVEEKGKKVPKKIGLAPEQGKGIEYEFDMLVEINQEHFATVTKDRTGKFQDDIIEKPDEKFGASLFDWLNAGAAPQPVKKSREQMIEEYTAARNELKNIMTTVVEDKPVFSPDEYDALVQSLAALKGKSAEEHLETINILLAEKKGILVERMNNRPRTTVSAIPAMYNEQEQEPDEGVKESFQEEMTEPDDGFVDDIPEESPPKRPRRNPPPSLSDEFQQHLRDREGTKAPQVPAPNENSRRETAQVGAESADELDIF